MRGAADATDSNNAAGLVKYGGELEGIDKRESAISASIGLYCAPP